MPQPDWVSDLHARGLLPALRTALDILEPVGALGAQFAYLIQPAAGLFSGQWRTALGEIGQALETPESLNDLRARLDELDAIDDG